MATIRTFVAVNIPATSQLESVIADLASLGRPVKPVSHEKLHVTLKFLGETDESLVPRISEIVRSVAVTKSAFELKICGLGVFPNKRRPSVVWAGLENAETLVTIAAEFELEFEQLGFQPESRPFQPHLTLARIHSKPPVELMNYIEQNEATDYGSASISSIDYYQSQLLPAGPKYTLLASAVLG